MTNSIGQVGSRVGVVGAASLEGSDKAQDEFSELPQTTGKEPLSSEGSAA